MKSPADIFSLTNLSDYSYPLTSGHALDITDCDFKSLPRNQISFIPFSKSYGACRLCTVEIVKGQRSRLVTSCVYTVEDGLVVKTESEPVVKGRKMLLEFMWARAPGVQPIRNYGMRYGITGVQAIRSYGISPTKTKFEIEPTFCILCGLCLRYCAELKKNAIGFIGRGTEREVVFFPEIAREECPNCEECYSLCPTGALPSHYALAEARHSA